MFGEAVVFRVYMSLELAGRRLGFGVFVLRRVARRVAFR